MRWIPFIIFLTFLQWYAFQALKTLTQNKVWWALYGLIVTLTLGSFYGKFSPMTVLWVGHLPLPILSVGLLL